MEVSKRKFIIIIILVVILALIPPIFIMKEVIHYKSLANNTEKIIRQIDADELESKLIEKLENTELNVDNYSYNTVFEVCGETGVDKASSFLVYYYDLMQMDYPYATNPYEGYILACIIENESMPERVYIPCFKIDRDENDKVENITYAYNGYYGIEDNMVNILNEVLREEYGIKSHSLDSIKYFRDKYKKFPISRSYYNYTRDLDIYITDNDFGATVISEICNDTGYNISEFVVKNDLIYGETEMTFTSWK